MNRYWISAWALPMVAAAPLALAQAAPGNSGLDPRDATATVPPVTYESPFAGYRILSDEKATSWKESNENVGRIGGWRAYAREAQRPESADEAAQGAANKPTPANGVTSGQGGRGGSKMD